MRSIWNKLFYYPARGWWALPRNRYAVPNGPDSGPFGTMRTQAARWFTRVTRGGGQHATPMFYVVIGVALALITLLEVIAFGWTWLGTLLVPLMLVLSALKFVMVVAFFMHLRFDNALFSWIFGACFVLGASVFVSVLALQKLLG